MTTQSRLHDECVSLIISALDRRGIISVNLEVQMKDTRLKVPDLYLPDTNTVVEVKTLQPTKEEQAEIDRINNDLRAGKMVGYFKPMHNARFVEDLEEARRKFRNFPNCSSVVIVCDLGDRFKQDPEMLMEGILQIHIATPRDPRLPSYHAGNSFAERPLRPNLNTEVGAIAFFDREDHSFQIYPNTHADIGRKTELDLRRPKDESPKMVEAVVGE